MITLISFFELKLDITINVDYSTDLSQGWDFLSSNSWSSAILGRRGGTIFVARFFQNRANWTQGPLSIPLLGADGQWIDYSGML
jgi:hypothetical protein